jgi:hypothetical protein
VTSPTHRAPDTSPTLWDDKPMPDVERRALGVATAVVWLFALAVNVNNVERHLRSGGASHGGTPEYWGQRKRAIREELAKLGAEAGNL